MDDIVDSDLGWRVCRQSVSTRPVEPRSSIQKQIEADSESGRLDFLVREAREADTLGSIDDL